MCDNIGAKIDTVKVKPEKDVVEKLGHPRQVLIKSLSGWDHPVFNDRN